MGRPKNKRAKQSYFGFECAICICSFDYSGVAFLVWVDHKLVWMNEWIGSEL